MKEYTKISFEITAIEEEIIKDAIFLEPFLFDNLRRIRTRDQNRLISFDTYDLFDLISALKECVGFSKSYRRQQEIKTFINRLSKYLSLIYNSEQKLGT
ncbi:MAG: hypothetical protein HQL25_00970 [Candidatus Omnitrophica bacterium]|nr:hypothetical protein [Candidatus Omnitrophota bacterium]